MTDSLLAHLIAQAPNKELQLGRTAHGNLITISRGFTANYQVNLGSISGYLVSDDLSVISATALRVLKDKGL